MLKQHFEDCQVGETATSLGRTITEADVVSFAALTGDWNPVHCDAEMMATHDIGGRIAHGLLVLSISTGFLFRMVGYELLPGQGIIFSGLDQVRFLMPVKLGDTLRLAGEVLETRAMGTESGLVVVRLQMRNQQDEAVMSAKAKFVVPRRPEAAEPTNDAVEEKTN